MCNAFFGIQAHAQTNTAPQIVATPVSFSEAPGLTHNIPVIYRDAQGANTLSSCWFGVNTSSSWTRAVWAIYVAQQNLIYLRDIDGKSWSAGVAPGSATVLSNGMGKINCAQTTVTRSGSELTINWNVTSANPLGGPNRVYAYADDAAGLNSGGATAGTFTDIGSWAITNQKPSVVVPSPALAFSTVTGQTQTASTTAYDANGWGNVRSIYFEVNDVDDWTNSFFVVYDSFTNLLYLRSDDGGSWLGGYQLGVAGTISNSSGTLDCGQTNIVRSGNNFKVNWGVAMKSGALGANTIFSYAEDRGGLNTGSPFTTVGSWNVGLSAPANLVAKAGNGQNTLTWGGVAGATSYQLFRSTTSGTYGSTALVTQTGRFYVDAGLVNGNTYYYVVRAYSPTSTSTNSNEASAKPLALPSAPTNIMGNTTDTSITLSWTPTDGTATSYRIEMASDANLALYSFVANTSATTYKVTGLSPKSIYGFRIAAINSSGTGGYAYSGQLVTRFASLRLTGYAGIAQATIQFQDSNTQPTSSDYYAIYRSTSASGPFAQVGRSYPGVTEWTDTNLSAVTYYYKAKIVRQGDDRYTSLDSNIVAIMPSPGPTATPRPTATAGPTPTTGPTQAPTPVVTPAPAVQAPGNLYVASSGSGKNTLYWDAVPNATGYFVHRGTTSGGENYSLPVTGATVSSQVSYSGSPIQMWTDTGLTDGTEYFYTVEATITGGAMSDPSNEDSDVPDPDSIPWDTRNPSAILGVAAGKANVSTVGDPIDPDQGFVMMGPDGAVYDRNVATQQPASGRFDDYGAFVTSSGDDIAPPSLAEDTSSTLSSAAPTRQTRTIPRPLTAGGIYRGAVSDRGYKESFFDVTLGPTDMSGRNRQLQPDPKHPGKFLGHRDTACVVLGSDQGPGTGRTFQAESGADSGLIRNDQNDHLWHMYLITYNHNHAKGQSDTFDLFSGNNKLFTNVGTLSGATFKQGDKVTLHYWLENRVTIKQGTGSAVFLQAFNALTGDSFTIGGLVKKHRRDGQVRMYRFQQVAQVKGPDGVGHYFHTGSYMADFNWETGRLVGDHDIEPHRWGSTSADLFSDPDYSNPVSSPPSYVIVKQYINAANEFGVSTTLPNDAGNG